MIKVSILMGSQSDFEVMKGAKKVLDQLEITNSILVLSAHRTPQLVIEHIKQMEEQGVEVFICGAGMAAHLAGAVSAHTVLPVIGVPLNSGALNGIDALLATVQMPPGMPVATIAVDGAQNAGILAAQIIASTDIALQNKIEALREKRREAIKQFNAEL